MGDNLGVMKRLGTFALILCLLPVCWCRAVALPAATAVDAVAHGCCDTAEGQSTNADEAPGDCGCCIERLQAAQDKPGYDLPAPNGVGYVSVTVLRIKSFSSAGAMPTRELRASFAGCSAPGYLAHQAFLR